MWSRISFSSFTTYSRSHRSCSSEQCISELARVWEFGVYIRHVRGMSREWLNSCLVFCQFVMLCISSIWFIYDNNCVPDITAMPWLKCVLIHRFTFFLGIRSDLNFILLHQFLAPLIGRTKHLYLGTCDFSEMFANQQICMCTHVI